MALSMSSNPLTDGVQKAEAAILRAWSVLVHYFALIVATYEHIVATVAGALVGSVEGLAKGVRHWQDPPALPAPPALLALPAPAPQPSPPPASRPSPARPIVNAVAAPPFVAAPPTPKTVQVAGPQLAPARDAYQAPGTPEPSVVGKEARLAKPISAADIQRAVRYGNASSVTSGSAPSRPGAPSGDPEMDRVTSFPLEGPSRTSSASSSTFTGDETGSTPRHVTVQPLDGDGVVDGKKKRRGGLRGPLHKAKKEVKKALGLGAQ